MKSQLIAIVAAVLMVGCGESQQSAPAPETPPAEPVAKVPAQPSSPQVEAELTEPVAEAVQPEPPKGKAPDISIHQAAYDGNIEDVKQHLAAGTDVNAKDDHHGSTPLNIAAIEGRKEVIELLIAAGADVNATTRTGRTPLDGAIVMNKTKIADLLRKHGGKQTKSINRQADYNLRMAAFYGRLEEVKQAITDGADVNSKNKQSGETPLHRAAKGKYYEIAKLLVSKGADVNAMSPNGSTPIHYAVNSASKELGQLANEIGKQSTNKNTSGKQIVELLIAGGADVNAKVVSGRYQGMTPLDMAIKRNHTETADLLRKHGGKTGEELKSEVNKLYRSYEEQN